MHVMQIDPPSRIRPNLYLGTWYNACNMPQLKELGVTHVLNMCGEERFAPPAAEYAAAGIACHRCSIVDQPDSDMTPFFREAMLFLQTGFKHSGPATPRASDKNSTSTCGSSDNAEVQLQSLRSFPVGWSAKAAAPAGAAGGSAEGGGSAAAPAAADRPELVAASSLHGASVAAGGAAGGPAALIHCEYGVSRSGTMCVAWLMRSEGLSLRQALGVARAGRPQVKPNAGFWRALITYERSLRPELPPSQPSEGCMLEARFLVQQAAADASSARFEPRWVELCPIASEPATAPGGPPRPPRQLQRGVSGGGLSMFGGQVSACGRSSETVTAGAANAANAANAGAAPGAGRVGELVVYASLTSFTPLQRIPLAGARLALVSAGGGECWSVQSDEAAEGRESAVVGGIASWPPAQKGAKNPPHVFSAVSRDECATWVAACARLGAIAPGAG